MLTQLFKGPISLFRMIMDPRVSPLRHLPDAQRFQIMCLLGMMWTLVFCLSAGAWLFYGQLLAVHALLALGALITGITFYNASRTARVVRTYRDYPRKDGSARYDDVWGG